MNVAAAPLLIPIGQASTQRLRLSEVIGALSYALDLTEGQPRGHCLRCCWIGMQIGMHLGLDQAALWDLYYTLLLKDAGCSSNAERLCELYGHDDIGTKRDFKLVNTDRLHQLARFVFEHAAPGQSLGERMHRFFNLALNGERLATELIVTRCERGADIARQLGFNENVATAIHSLDEHWNGKGRPARLAGAAIPLGARIALFAQVVDVFHQANGIEATLTEIRARTGSWFDPQLTAVFEELAADPAFWHALADPGLPEQVVTLEPAGAADNIVDDDKLDAIAAAFAQVVDAKSHFTYGHSDRVARYSDLLAAQLGIDVGRRRWLRRGALLHDIGKLGVSNAVLDKPAQLDMEEWERVREHPRLTAEILGRITPFAELARVAGAHHERLDGKGYPFGLSGDAISLETRIITTCDIFDAITAERPYRAAIPLAQALPMLEKLRGNALDGNCIDALIECLPDFNL